MSQEESTNDGRNGILPFGFRMTAGKYEERHNKVPGYYNFDYWMPSNFWIHYKNDWENEWVPHWGHLFVPTKGAQTTHPRKPLKGLYRDPEIWEQLDDSEKETLNILDRRLLGMPTHALKAMAFHFAKRCDKENQLFALAKSEFRDPRATLRMGDKLSQCAEDTFEFTLKNCRSTFTDFSRCFERNPERFVFLCRPEQYAFDKCMSEHGQEKAKLAVREAVIKDEDVPWGAKPKNPHNFRVVQVESKKCVDPLRPMNQVPDNDAFRAFLEKKNSQ